jgi:ribonuclease VapC
LVVDTSILLAIFFGESHAAWAVEQLEHNRGALSMSTVNLTETLIILRDRQPARYAQLEMQVVSGGIRFVAPDVEQARIAAEARLRYPLNLGDCFAYALARAEGTEILTLDLDFRSLDVPVVLP